MLRITQATVASEYSAITSVLLLLYSANTDDSYIYIAPGSYLFFNTTNGLPRRLITSCANLSVSCDLHSGWYKYKTAIIISDEIIVAYAVFLYFCGTRERIQLPTPYT